MISKIKVYQHDFSKFDYLFRDDVYPTLLIMLTINLMISIGNLKVALKDMHQ